MNDADLGQNIKEQSKTVDKAPVDAPKIDEHLIPTRWWFASAALPMVAGTLGPVASAFSICALVQPWRLVIPPGADVTEANPIPDPPWLTAVNAVQLVVAVVANAFLLLNMTQRIRFSIAQPLTIIGWYVSSACLIALTATADGPLSLGDEPNWVWSQAYFYGVYSAVLYFFVSSLMVITVWGAYAGHYSKDFNLTPSQRTLMLQTLAFLMYLLIGALIFSHIENWRYLDAVYWADVTLFTVGFGDLSPDSTLGRALMMPYALVGITSLGLVIGSIRSLVLDRGKSRFNARMLEKKRRRMIQRISKKGDSNMLDPVNDEETGPFSEPTENGISEFDRRHKEFRLMRKLQERISRRRRWTAMAVSTLTTVVLWLVGSKIFMECEDPYQGWTYFDAFYFTYTALTTIGYGDITPVSNGAKSFFVLWSLLALPAMTVVISNAGDTIVKEIRDGTLRLGNLTVLPGENGFGKEIRSLLSRVTFGKIYGDNQDVELSLPGFLGAAHSIKDSTDDTDEPVEEREKQQQDDRAGSNQEIEDAGPRNSNRSDGNKVDKKAHSQALEPTRIPKSRPEYHLVLIDEISRITQHLKDDTPRKYTYQEWAWYLRLIGEDESSTETHQRPRTQSAVIDRQLDADVTSPYGPVGSGSQWSWVGHKSPLMATRTESQWILEQLEKKLKEELQEIAQSQVGSGGVHNVRKEEARNEHKKTLFPATD